jgi:hypothetical protein
MGNGEWGMENSYLLLLTTDNRQQTIVAGFNPKFQKQYSTLR